jgi:hypothetical protein
MTPRRHTTGNLLDGNPVDRGTTLVATLETSHSALLTKFVVFMNTEGYKYEDINNPLYLCGNYKYHLL